MRAGVWTTLNVAMDISGASAAVSLARTGLGVLRTIGTWVSRKYAESVTLGAAISIVEAGATGDLTGRDAQVAGAHGFLGSVGTFVPGVGSTLSAFGTYNACWLPD